MADNHHHHHHGDHGHSQHDHGHSHSHGNGHHHSAEVPTDVAQANKEYFDALAEEAQPIDPKWIEIAGKNGIAIRENYNFDESSTVLMDFACNTGLTSRELVPYTKKIIGIDISQKTVDAFNQTILDQGISSEKIRALCMNLKGVEGELDGLKFDVITCAASYHHFADINEITRILTFFLKPGGTLLVLDLTKPEPKPQPQTIGDSGKPLWEFKFEDKYKHIVPHTHGIEKDKLEAAFVGAGLEEFEFKPICETVIHNMEVVLFIAKGVKALE